MGVSAHIKQMKRELAEETMSVLKTKTKSLSFNIIVVNFNSFSFLLAQSLEES